MHSPQTIKRPHHGKARQIRKRNFLSKLRQNWHFLREKWIKDPELIH